MVVPTINATKICGVYCFLFPARTLLFFSEPRREWVFLRPCGAWRREQSNFLAEKYACLRNTHRERGSLLNTSNSAACPPCRGRESFRLLLLQSGGYVHG